ncbi:MAG: hypothetical protein U0Y96_09935 [Candidatus Kapaibacterium sp.]
MIRCISLMILLCLHLHTTSAQIPFALPLESVSARTLALGNTGTSYNPDGSAYSTNCALVALHKTTMLSGMYTSSFGELSKPLNNSFWVGVVVPYEPFSFSCNWVRSSSSDVRNTPSIFSSTFAEREKQLQQTGVISFIPQMNDVITISAARQNIVKLDWGWNQYAMPIEIPVGVNVRFVRSVMNDVTTHGVAFDFGAMLKLNLRDMSFDENYPKISFGWMLKNLGGMTMNWSTTVSDYSPYQYAFGMAIEQPIKPLDSQLNILYDTKSEYTGSNHIGLEWVYRKFFAARFGVASTNVTVGTGVDLDFFMVDYGFKFSSNNVLGNVHRLTCSFRLERLL